MPPGGAAARADQLATLVRVKHYRLAADEIGRLVDELSGYEESLAARFHRGEPDPGRAPRPREGGRVPPDLEAELARAAATGEHAWREARERSDFGLLLPHLRRNVELRRHYVECFPTWTTPTTRCSTTSSPG